jgi:hypothetical protein
MNDSKLHVLPSPADRYSKATEVWYLLHKIEQLIINDPDYSSTVINSVNNCMDIVETLQHGIEVSGQ